MLEFRRYSRTVYANSDILKARLTIELHHRGLLAIASFVVEQFKPFDFHADK
jgi:hypothetical protein